MADMLTSDRGRDRLRRVCGRIVSSCTERGDERERRAFKLREGSGRYLFSPHHVQAPASPHLRPFAPQVKPPLRNNFSAVLFLAPSRK
jgi:hypothetical protein